MFDSLGASSSSSSSSMNGLHFLPPGYRFHPTDEELVKYYLTNKVSPLDEGHRLGSVSAIVEVDLNKCEPWDLPDQAKIGEKEWYFYSLRDRKYPTGLRTNRATEAGYWKATGKDRLISNTDNGHLIGMKKTLVFYLGRAPKGEKTHWIMHEYRLSSQQKPPSIMSLLPKEEWVICRVFKKNHSSSSGTNNITNELITRHNLCLTNESEINATNCLPSLLDSPNTMAEEIHHPKQERDYASTNQLGLFNHPSQSSSTSSSLILNYPANPDLNPPTNSVNPYSVPSIDVLKALLDHYSCSVSTDPKIQYPSSINTILYPWSDMAPTQVHAHAPVNLSLNQMESGFLGGDMIDINRAREYNHLEAYGLY